MKLTFLGANRQVTGSRYCLETANHKVMIDCGMVQEREYLARNWDCCPISPESLDALFLTHVHIDHCGLIPKLVRDGFQGPIYATPPSVALVEIMFRDAARIQEEDAKYKKRRHEREGRRGPHPEIPLYTERDVDRALPLFRATDYDTLIKVNEEFSVTFRDAGHILGSASLEVVVKEEAQSRRFIFSGDIGQWNRPLMNDPTTFEQADYVVMESTYGDRDHKKAGDVEEQMAEVINRTIDRGGNIVIPTFAVERAQELIYHISRLVHLKKIPELPVYLDSPMAVDVTQIYRQCVEFMDAEARKMAELLAPPMSLPPFIHLVSRVADSKAINSNKVPSIIMSASGMCNAGRIKHHLRNNISRHECTILFVGFQARGTLGRRILEGKKEVRIHGQSRRVQAEITQVSGFSGHADRTDLLRWIGNLKSAPRQIFLTHGEERASLKLAEEIETQFQWPASVPVYGQTYDFDLSEKSGFKQTTGSVLRTAQKELVDQDEEQDEEQARLAREIESNADLELLNCPLEVSSDFLVEDPWRVLRIQSDVVQGLEMMSRALRGCRRSVSVFGSARTESGHADYKLAMNTCKKLGQSGFAIITGGGPGIMEAANRGARLAKARSIAINISLPQEQKVNSYVDFHYTCHYFFVRKMMFAKYGQAFVIFPGGFGTLDELFESLTLIQTEKLSNFPVVLVGKDYWDPLFDWLRDETFHRGFIDASDIKRFKVLDSADEVAEYLTNTGICP